MKWTVALLASIALLGACQTEPEPCTADWVEWKTDRVLTRFGLANYSEVKRLRDFSEDLQADDIGPLLALQIPSMITEFQDLAEKFEQSALPALNEAVQQCGGPQELAPAFLAYLEKEGVGEDVLEWAALLAGFAGEL